MSNNSSSNLLTLRNVENDEIINETRVNSKENFESKFREYCKDARRLGYKLIIDKYEFLRGQIPLLKLLENIDFTINDFDRLNQESIPVLVQHMELEKTNVGRKISNKLKDRRNAGLEIGNPKIAEQARTSAIKQRIRLAIYDSQNLDAAKIILKQKGENIPLNSIAEYLNNNEYKTRRGGSFYAKSCERIYERYSELKNNFNPNHKLFSKENKKGVSNSKLKKYGLKDNYRYEDTISVDLSKYPNTKVEIYNNSDKLPILSFDLETVENGKFELSVAKTREFIPGLYYFLLKDVKDDTILIYQEFNISKELMEHLQVL